MYAASAIDASKDDRRTYEAIPRINASPARSPRLGAQAAPGDPTALSRQLIADWSTTSNAPLSRPQGPRWRHRVG